MRYMFTMVVLAVLVVMATPSVYATTTEIYPSDRGYAEGYSHWPMSFPHNSVYVDAYKIGVRDYAWALQDKGSLTFLGTLPAHSTDNYKDFYLGEQAGADAYNATNVPPNYDYRKCPAGHSAEFCAGYRFGWGIPLNFGATR